MRASDSSLDGTSSSCEAEQLLADYAAEPNALERRALRLLGGSVREGSVPISDECRGQLRWLQRRTVAFGVLSGTASGLLLGGAEIWIAREVIGDEERSFLDDPAVWAGFYGLVGLVTLIEIAFLYWITLRAVARLKRIVGVPDSGGGTPDLLRVALARAALEMPDPRETILGVDPHAFKPRWELYARSIAYKAKVGVTSFVMRVVLRRLFVRAVVRSYVPLLAAPLYAAWNAWILHRVMEEARVRAFGPFAVRQILGAVAERSGNEAWTRAVAVAVAGTVRRSGKAHPNYVLLLHGLRDLDGFGRDEWRLDETEDPAAFSELPDAERQALSRLLLLTDALGGRTKRLQRRFLRDAHRRLGLSYEAAASREARQALREGRVYPLDRTGCEASSVCGATGKARKPSYPLTR